MYLFGRGFGFEVVSLEGVIFVRIACHGTSGVGEELLLCVRDGESLACTANVNGDSLSSASPFGILPTSKRVPV